MSNNPGFRTRLGLCLSVCILCMAHQLGAQNKVPSKNASTSIDRWMQLGTDAMRQGKVANAEEDFRQATLIAPQLADAHFALGLAQLRQGKVDVAEKSLSRSVELNPSIPGAYMFLGIARYQINHLQGAITALRQAVRIEPKNPEALTWLGIVELAAGQPDQAAEPLDRAAALTPADANVLYYQGRAHMLIAQNAYQALYRLDPDSWYVHRALAENYSAMGQPEKAIAECEAAIKKRPTDPDLYEFLGDEDQKVSRFVDAAKAYSQELVLNPHSAIALYNLGKIKVETGDPENGVLLLQQAVDAHASPAPAYFYLGLGLSMQGKNQEAVQWLERVLQNSPSDFIRQSDYYELARVYQKLNRKADAQHALEELKKLKAQAATTISNPTPQ